MHLTMVGTGYVGLVTGVCFANTGNTVTCLDVDPVKIEALSRGRCPIYEPGLEELLAHNLKAGRLHFTLDRARAYGSADAVFICVGTPTGADGSTDLSYVFAAADDIADSIRARPASAPPLIVVVKSTVPVGTSLALKERIAGRIGPGGAARFRIANNPEFLKEGDAVNDFNKPDRVVCGVEDEATAEFFRTIYDPFVRNGHPIFVMDILSSEMVKYASNNFLATKISFINEMANLCEAYGADIARVREGMCADRRIGYQFLYPGLGYGGSCFPKDTLACIMMGEKAGIDPVLSRAVHAVNQRQRQRFFEKIVAHFAPRGGLRGRTLAFWGLSFKPRTDDIREAPALSLIRRAAEAGAAVRAFDPVAGPNAARELGAAATIVPDMYDAARGADALVVCTDWDEFKSPDWDRLSSGLKEKVIFDGRNLYRPGLMREHGFTYYCVGRAPVRPA